MKSSVTLWLLRENCSFIYESTVVYRQLNDDVYNWLNWGNVETTTSLKRRNCSQNEWYCTTASSGEWIYEHSDDSFQWRYNSHRLVIQLWTYQRCHWGSKRGIMKVTWLSELSDSVGACARNSETWRPVLFTEPVCGVDYKIKRSR